MHNREQRIDITGDRPVTTGPITFLNGINRRISTATMNISPCAIIWIYVKLPVARIVARVSTLGTSVVSNPRYGKLWSGFPGLYAKRVLLAVSRGFKQILLSLSAGGLSASAQAFPSLAIVAKKSMAHFIRRIFFPASTSKRPLFKCLHPPPKETETPTAA